jgi:hypothetical protein
MNDLMERCTIFGGFFRRQKLTSSVQKAGQVHDPPAIMPFHSWLRERAIMPDTIDVLALQRSA